MSGRNSVSGPCDGPVLSFVHSGIGTIAYTKMAGPPVTGVPLAQPGSTYDALLRSSGDQIVPIWGPLHGSLFTANMVAVQVMTSGKTTAAGEVRSTSKACAEKRSYASLACRACRSSGKLRTHKRSLRKESTRAGCDQATSGGIPSSCYCTRSRADPA